MHTEKSNISFLKRVLYKTEWDILTLTGVSDLTARALYVPDVRPTVINVHYLNVKSNLGAIGTADITLGFTIMGSQ